MNKVLLDHAQKSELCYVKDLTRPLLLRICGAHAIY